MHRCSLKQTLSERLAENHHMLDRVVRDIFGEMAGRIAEDQPEEQNGEHDVEQQRDLDERIDQISAQKGIHARELALLEPRVAQHVPRGGDNKPHAENGKKNESQRAGTDQHGQVAVVEVHHERRQIAVVVGKLDTVFKHPLAVAVDIALADTENRVLDKHL